jgi:hypothetical protein
MCLDGQSTLSMTMEDGLPRYTTSRSAALLCTGIRPASRGQNHCERWINEHVAIRHDDRIRGFE